VIKKQQHSVFE